MRLIPRIIHYCWFGGKAKPKDIQRYIDGWKKKLPDYTFIEWNEDNFDIALAPAYVQEAYRVKKYAFVSDYVRIKALYKQGGIYLDTDIEILKSFDKLLEDREMVLGFENAGSVETAFIASIPDNPILSEFLTEYEMRKFIKPDGSYDMSVINEHFSDLLGCKGIQTDISDYQEINNGKIVIYPIEYFAGFDVENWHVRITKNTYTVHHMNASWAGSKLKLHTTMINLTQKLLGYDRYDNLKKRLRNC